MNAGLWQRLEADARARKIWNLNDYLSQVLEVWAASLVGVKAAESFEPLLVACSTACTAKPWREPGNSA